MRGKIIRQVMALKYGWTVHPQNVCGPDMGSGHVIARVRESACENSAGPPKIRFRSDPRGW